MFLTIMQAMYSYDTVSMQNNLNQLQILFFVMVAGCFGSLALCFSLDTIILDIIIAYKEQQQLHQLEQMCCLYFQYTEMNVSDFGKTSQDLGILEHDSGLVGQGNLPQFGTCLFIIQCDLYTEFCFFFFRMTQLLESAGQMHFSSLLNTIIKDQRPLTYDIAFKKYTAH